MNEEDLKFIRLAISLGWKALNDVNKFSDGYSNTNNIFLTIEKLAEKIGVDTFDILETLHF